MSVPDLLLTSLLDLDAEVREAGIGLAVGGGFGLWLKRRQVREGVRRLLQVLPAARSTNDLDVFLQAEVLTKRERAVAFQSALSRLGYVPIIGAEYMQFARTMRAGEESRTVKIDLLLNPLDAKSGDIRLDSRRVKPPWRGLHLHARRIEEAVDVHKDPVEIIVEGCLSNRSLHRAVLHVPAAAPYLVMKLFAFRDRKHDPDPTKDSGRHHAMDLYGIVAMMTEEEYEATKTWLADRAAIGPVLEAGRIVASDFATPEGDGVLRLKEHTLFRPEMELADFLSLLHEFFGPISPRP